MTIGGQPANIGFTLRDNNAFNYVLKTGGTITGLLIIPNITLGSNGKINGYDDYHYIQISQPTDTLTIQAFGKIIFSVGQTKTEIGRINSSGLTRTGAITATSLSGSGSGLTHLNYNNISTNKPDLTLYAVKSNVDASLNSLNTNKQNNFTFSNPLIKMIFQII
jgi:hypothetical protein